jgi:hypothetical protein
MSRFTQIAPETAAGKIKSIPPPGIKEYAWQSVNRGEAIGQPIAVTKRLGRLATSWVPWVGSCCCRLSQEALAQRGRVAYP